jgi:hypothetical protein
MHCFCFLLLSYELADGAKQILDKMSRKVSNSFSKGTSARSRDSIGNDKDTSSDSNNNNSNSSSDEANSNNSNSNSSSSNSSSSSKRTSTSSDSSLIVINLANISGHIPNVQWQFKQRVIEDGGILVCNVYISIITLHI